MKKQNMDGNKLFKKNLLVLRKVLIINSVLIKNWARTNSVIKQISKFMLFFFIIPHKICYNDKGDIMFNKIYAAVKKFIIDNYKYLIVLFLILFLGLYRLPYNLLVGGGIIDINDRLEVENAFKITGSYNLAYVKETKATIPFYLLSYLFNWERESIEDSKIDENDSSKDIWEREKMYLEEANNSAIISASSLAGIDIKINKEILKVLYIDKDSDTNLKIGDIIEKIDGMEVKEYSDIASILTNKNISDRVDVEYIRDNQKQNGYFIVREMDGMKKAGLYLIKLYDYEIDKNISINFPNNEGGPSGGLMTSLALYDKLTEKDLTKGKTIVGTGTIDINGNVGEIGGVKYKLKGAVSGKADIFFVPEANYQEAVNLKKEKEYNIDIVMVKTLSDAVQYLESR